MGYLLVYDQQCIVSACHYSYRNKPIFPIQDFCMGHSDHWKYPYSKPFQTKIYQFYKILSYLNNAKKNVQHWHRSI